MNINIAFGEGPSGTIIVFTTKVIGIGRARQVGSKRPSSIVLFLANLLHYTRLLVLECAVDVHSCGLLDYCI